MKTKSKFKNFWVHGRFIFTLGLIGVMHGLSHDISATSHSSMSSRDISQKSHNELRLHSDVSEYNGDTHQDPRQLRNRCSNGRCEPNKTGF